MWRVNAICFVRFGLGVPELGPFLKLLYPYRESLYLKLLLQLSSHLYDFSWFSLIPLTKLRQGKYSSVIVLYLTDIHCVITDPIIYTRPLFKVFNTTSFTGFYIRKKNAPPTRKYTGSTIFTACIVCTAIVCWHFYTFKQEKYLRATRRPRYNGVWVILDRVIMESQCI